MKLALIFLLPLLLASAEPDRLTNLVAEMRRLTFAGDQFSVRSLAPALLEELEKPHPKAALGWNQVGVYFDTQFRFEEAERAYQSGIRLLEREGISNGDLALGEHTRLLISPWDTPAAKGDPGSNPNSCGSRGSDSARNRRYPQ